MFQSSKGPGSHVARLYFPCRNGQVEQHIVAGSKSVAIPLVVSFSTHVVKVDMEHPWFPFKKKINKSSRFSTCKRLLEGKRTQAIV